MSNLAQKLSVSHPRLWAIVFALPMALISTTVLPVILLYEVVVSTVISIWTNIREIPHDVWWQVRYHFAYGGRILAQAWIQWWRRLYTDSDVDPDESGEVVDG